MNLPFDNLKELSTLDSSRFELQLRRLTVSDRVYFLLIHQYLAIIRALKDGP